MTAGSLDLDQQVHSADIGLQEHDGHGGANEPQQFMAYAHQVFPVSDIHLIGEVAELESGARCSTVRLRDDGGDVVETFPRLRTHIARV